MIPDSALAKAAREYLLSTSPIVLVNHCERTYLFGAALLDKAGRAYDAEVLYVASALHDLGLVEQFEDGITPFEVRGAAVAREFLGESRVTDLVCEAISLHLKASAAADERPEVAGVSMGAGVDVAGLRYDELPASLIAQVLEEFPRLNAKQFLTEVLRRQTSLKPDSQIARHVSRYRFTELVAAAPFES